MQLRDLVEKQRENPWKYSSISPSVFNCEHPIRIFNRYLGEYVHVPCRKCRCCLSALSLQKSSRLIRDTENYDYNFFVTLTFDAEHLPLAHFSGIHVDDDGNWFTEWRKSTYDCLKRKRVYSDDYFAMPLDQSYFVAPKHCKFSNVFSVADSVGFQKFMKRLRKRISKLPNYDKETYKIRYAFCNEFGPKTYRAHLHGVLSTNCKELAASLPVLVRSCWSCYHKVSHGRYERHGFCSPKRLTIKRIFGSDAQKYVCKYISGSYDCPPLLRCKPFRSFFLNSRFPALGLKKGDDETAKIIFTTCNVVQRIYNEKTKEFVECLIPDILFNQFFRQCARYSTSSTCDREKILRAYSAVDEIGQLKINEFDANHFQTKRIFNEQNTLYYKCYKYWCSVFPSLTIHEYVTTLDRIYSNRALYLLRSFYEKQEYISQHIVDTAKLIAFYPELLASLPDTCNYRHWLYLDKKYNYSSFGLDFSDLYYIDNFDLLHSYAHPWDVLTRGQENEVPYHLYIKSVSALNLQSWSDNHSKTIHTIMNNSNKTKKYNDSLNTWDCV